MSSTFTGRKGPNPLSDWRVDPATFRTLGARFLGPEVESVEAWRWN